MTKEIILEFVFKQSMEIKLKKINLSADQDQLILQTVGLVSFDEVATLE
jgi:hypothetical protein